MQPWKISIGLTAIILAMALMLAGESFAYLKPYLGIIATDYWMPVAWYGGLAVVTLMVMIYSAARALGLADMGRKVDLMERSIRRGEGGQTELARETGTRGPGAVSRSLTRNNRIDTEGSMKNNNSIVWKRGALLVSVLALSAGELMAQGTSPWLQAIDVLQQAFTGPIARGLSLIAIVVGGLMFAFGEGGSKKALAGIVFGLGMAMGAANFLAWLF